MADKDKIHGNSKKSKKKQHIYKIEDSKIPVKDKTFKFGVSGKKLNKNGTSARANSQVNVLNKLTGDLKRFFATVLMIDIDGRSKVLDIEKECVRKYKKENKTLFPPPGQRRPNPEQ